MLAFSAGKGYHPPVAKDVGGVEGFADGLFFRAGLGGVQIFMGLSKRTLWRAFLCVVLLLVLGPGLLAGFYYGRRAAMVWYLGYKSKGLTRTVPEQVVWTAPESLERLQQIDLGFASFYLPKREWYTVHARPTTNSHTFAVGIYGDGVEVWCHTVGMADSTTTEFAGQLGVEKAGFVDIELFLAQTPPVSWREVFSLSKEEFTMRLVYLTMKTTMCSYHQYIAEGPHCRGLGGGGTSNSSALELTGKLGSTSIVLYLGSPDNKVEALANIIGGTFTFKEDVPAEETPLRQAAFVERVRKGEGDDARFIVLNLKAMPTFPLADALKAAERLLAAEGIERQCAWADSMLSRDGDGWLLRYGPNKEEGFGVIVTPDSARLIKDRHLAVEYVPSQPIEDVLPLIEQTPERFTVSVYSSYGEKWEAQVYERGNGHPNTVSLISPQDKTE